MAVLTFKFRTDLLEAFWLKYEIQLGIEDVIIAFKKAESILDIIMALGVIANALKKTQTFAARFLAEEDFRDELAGETDSFFQFGGFPLGTLVEKIDRSLIKKVFDMAAQKAQIAEDQAEP